MSGQTTFRSTLVNTPNKSTLINTANFAVYPLVNPHHVQNKWIKNITSYVCAPNYDFDEREMLSAIARIGEYVVVFSVMKACTVDVLIREAATGESYLQANNH